jgi:hypothetical protein
MLTKEEIARIDLQVKAELPEIMERQRRKQVALREQSVSGQLRRAILETKLLYPDISELAGVTMQELDDFMTGEPVSSKVFDRLAAAIKYELTPVE